MGTYVLSEIQEFGNVMRLHLSNGCDGCGSVAPDRWFKPNLGFVCVECRDKPFIPPKVVKGHVKPKAEA